MWVDLKITRPLGYRLYYGTSYLGVPKWDPNFGNYPCREPALEVLVELREILPGLLLRNLN